MSSAQPKPVEVRASEPSMEEILASIRRIISDDQAAKPSVRPDSPPLSETTDTPQAVVQEEVTTGVQAAAEEEEILDLPARSRRQEPHFIADDPVGNDISFEEPAPPATTSGGQDDVDALMAAEDPPASPPVETVAVAAAAPTDRLISPTTDRAVSSAFTSLANTVLSTHARTLDDVVQDMLRPMIKSWLDDNLPGIVERLVRAEIERVSRGGR